MLRVDSAVVGSTGAVRSRRRSREWNAGRRPCPIEYKSGVRHGAAADLQLCAQALCLEEMLDVEITGGRRLVRRPAAPDSASTSRRHCDDEVRSGHRVDPACNSSRVELPDAPNDPSLLRSASFCTTACPSWPARPRRVDPLHDGRGVPMRYLSTVYVREAPRPRAAPPGLAASCPPRTASQRISPSRRLTRWCCSAARRSPRRRSRRVSGAACGSPHSRRAEPFVSSSAPGPAATSICARPSIGRSSMTEARSLASVEGRRRGETAEQSESRGAIAGRGTSRSRPPPHASTQGARRPDPRARSLEAGRCPTPPTTSEANRRRCGPDLLSAPWSKSLENERVRTSSRRTRRPPRDPGQRPARVLLRSTRDRVHRRRRRASDWTTRWASSIAHASGQPLVGPRSSPKNCGP